MHNIDDMFDEGNEKQNWDELENLARKQNARHQFWQLSDSTESSTVSSDEPLVEDV